MTREWYFLAMGQELGPLSASELKAKVTNGQIQPDTQIRKGTEGKWTFAANFKGLFTVAEKPPPPVSPPAAERTRSSLTSSTAVSSKSDSRVDLTANVSSKPLSSGPIPATVIKLVEDDETNSHPPSVEFYDFVGFREAISPVLHDAVRHFATDRGITLSQLNRRALATFIERPELASDLMITAVAALPQQVNDKSNKDGSRPLSEREKVEVATFQFTLFNSSHNEVHVEAGTFLPESVEERTYHTVGVKQHPSIEHCGHIQARLRPRTIGKAIQSPFDLTIPPQATRDVFIWFYDDSKPSLTKVRGQMLIGHGGELAMSEFFTITLHGDSPSPDS